MVNDTYSRTIAFLTCCIFFSLLSACSTLPDFLKPTASETGNYVVYRVLEKNVPATAGKYVGIPYRWGADPDKTNASDCSHLIAAVTRNSLSGSGYHAAHPLFTTDDIKKNSFPIKESEVQAGDIVFFTDKDGLSDANHAGLVTARQGNTIFYIQASSSKGVMMTSTGENSWREYWRRRFDSYRRWKKSVFAGT